MSKLTIAQANRIVAAGFEYAHNNKIKPLGIVVLDDSGNIVSAQRDDGATMFRIDVATGKAWAAVGMGASSRALAQRAKDNPNFFVALAATGKGKFLPQTGAVLIKDAAGNVLGAAGASGGTGEEDEAACMHGIETAGLVHG
ncbi:MAG: GlcG/HbpS family heme-binding protein [Burkholderiales bacterium]